jgi:hypothetical protein
LLKLKDGQLKLAHIEVIYDSEAASRELIAIKEFSNVGDKNSRLDPTRQALISNPASREFTLADVTLGVPPTKEHRAQYEKDYQKWATTIDNKQQLAVLDAPRRVRDLLSVCIGPPETGQLISRYFRRMA